MLSMDGMACPDDRAWLEESQSAFLDGMTLLGSVALLVAGSLDSVVGSLIED